MTEELQPKIEVEKKPFLQRFKDFRSRRIKFLDVRILAEFIILLVLLFLTFRATYHTAEEINFELQYKNYLKSVQDPLSYDTKFSGNWSSNIINVTVNNSKIDYNKGEDLQFPNYLKYLLGLSFFLVLNLIWDVITKYNRIRSDDFDI